MRSLRALPLLVVASVAMTACTASTSTDGDSTASARAASSVPADKFTVEPKQEPVAGENVLVFRYPSTREARLDAAKLSDDGTQLGGKPLPWTGTPRFFRKEAVMVLYTGTNPAVIDALKSGYGEPFAGPAMGSAASASAGAAGSATTSAVSS